MADLVKTRRKNRIKMTPIQVQMLVDILYENSEIASGKLSATFTREERMKKWNAIATLLNSKGLGPQKTTDQWRKSWNDLKFATRSKASKIELSGGTDLMNEKLSNLEKRVLQLTGDITVEVSEESKEKPKLLLKNLEADLAKTEEDLLKVLKKPNQILLPKTLSQILEERDGIRIEMPFIENVVAKENVGEKRKNGSIKVSSDCPSSPIINDNSVINNNDGDVSCQDNSDRGASDDDIIYDESDINEDDLVTFYKPLSPPPKKRKVPSDEKASTTSSGSNSFISVFQRQIETQTAVLKEQTSIMRDIAKSLRLIASSLHGS